MRILFLGDIAGSSGRNVVKSLLPSLKKEYSIDLVFANVENIASGKGITQETLNEVLEAGVDFCTSGDHVWHFKNFVELLRLQPNTKVIRPANYPPKCPGNGWCIIENMSMPILLINLLGRQFMRPHVDDPYRTMDKILNTVPKNSYKFSVLDYHAETTSEKIAMGWYLDGKLGMIVGTHTHVGTVDTRILPNGTAYVTDLGMCGAYNGVLGVDRDIILSVELDQMPRRFEMQQDTELQLGAVMVETDKKGKVLTIERVDRKLKI